MSDDEFSALVERDPIAALCQILREVGATMTLYGVPVGEDELRSSALNSAAERLSKATGVPPNYIKAVLK